MIDHVESVLFLVYPRLTSQAHLQRSRTAHTLCVQPVQEATAHRCHYIADGARICPACLGQAATLGYACPICGIVTVGFPAGARCVRCDGARAVGRS